jgi:hypothetical protein
VKVNFLDKSALNPPPRPPKFIDPSDVQFVVQALLDGRKIGAYTDLAPGSQQYLSRSRVSTPLHGKRRLVHALCPLNNATVKQPTRYETLKSLPNILKPNDFMVSLDVESAFFHVVIAESHRKYFSSHFAIPAFVRGEFIPLQPGGYWCCTNPRLHPTPSASTKPHLRHFYYQVIEWSHSSLPLGWTSSPRIWGEVINVVNCALKRAGIRTLLYVDDLLACCGTEAEAFLAREIIAKTLEDAGITKSPTKGQWNPSQVLHDHLGNIIDSKGAGCLQLPERRCAMIRRAARHLLYQASTNRRLICSKDLQRFTGQAVSALSAIPLALFRLRSLYNCQERFRPRSFLTQRAIDDLLYWRHMSTSHPDNMHILWPDVPTTALTTDASGSILEVPLEARRESGGFWMPWERQQIIALKELKAVQHGLHENLPLIQGKRIRLFQDNTNVVACLTKFSSRSKLLMDELYHIVPWLQKHQISLEVLYIRSEHNIADPASRRRNADLWSLKPRTQNFLLQQVQQHLGQSVDTDPFACHQSAVAARYCTPLHDRHSAGFNGLLLNWSPPHVVYLNPPWNLLPQVLLKMQASRAKGVVVYPDWPLQLWFADLEACNKAIFHLPSPYTCVRPHHPGKVEPFLHRGLVLKAMLFDFA